MTWDGRSVLCRRCNLLSQMLVPFSDKWVANVSKQHKLCCSQPQNKKIINNIKINVLCGTTNTHCNNWKLSCLRSSRSHRPFTACTWDLIWQVCLVCGIILITMIKQDETGEIRPKKRNLSRSRPLSNTQAPSFKNYQKCLVLSYIIIHVLNSVTFEIIRIVINTLA